MCAYVRLRAALTVACTLSAATALAEYPAGAAAGLAAPTPATATLVDQDAEDDGVGVDPDAAADRRRNRVAENLLRRFGPEHEGLAREIDDTIDRGVAYLVDTQAEDGSWPLYEASYPLGGTALCALAVRKSYAGYYAGDADDLEDEIEDLQRDHDRGRITPHMRLRLQFLQENGAHHIAVRARLDPVVERAMAYLRQTYATQRERGRTVRVGRGQVFPHKVYAVGVMLMLIEAYYSQPDPEARGIEPDVLDPRRMPRAGRNWAQELVTFLEDSAVAPMIGDEEFSEGRSWRYPTRGHDNSCAQYAALGLMAAQRMQIEVSDRGLWRKVAEYFMAAQAKEGVEVDRVRFVIDRRTGRYRVADNREPEDAADEEDEEQGEDETDTTEDGALVDRARGWAYSANRVEGQFNTGAMTTAGIAGLVTAKSALYASRALARDPELARRIDTALHDGRAWLHEYYSVARNPAEGGTARWYYYYMYGLERAGVLLGTEHFGQHAWYIEGARRLIDIQQRQDHGGWGAAAANGSIGRALRQTAFAILFLKRATLPLDLPRNDAEITGD